MIEKYPQEDYTNFLASFLPEGKYTVAKNIDGSNLRGFIKGSSVEIKRMGDLFCDILVQIHPETTDIFLEEWEAALNIPDECIPLSTDKQERRDNILLKLASLSLQTRQDFIDIAASYGFTISFRTIKLPPFDVPATPDSFLPESVFPPFDVPATPNYIEENKFSILIEGNFSSNPEKANIIQCLFRKLLPSTYKIHFFNVP